jgi:hypothetical protein
MHIDLENGRLDVDITHDGARNATFDIVGETTADLDPIRIIDIKELVHEAGYKITRLRLDWVQYYVGEGLSAELLWEGEDDVHKHILTLSGKGRSEHEKMGGKQNNSVKPTGNIMLAISGSDGKRRTFSIEVEAVKQFT